MPTQVLSLKLGLRQGLGIRILRSGNSTVLSIGHKMSATQFLKTQRLKPILSDLMQTDGQYKSQAKQAQELNVTVTESLARLK